MGTYMRCDPCTTTIVPLPARMSAAPFEARQIVVPAELPHVLKEFTKEALRAAPADLIAWSAS